MVALVTNVRFGEFYGNGQCESKALCLTSVVDFHPLDVLKFLTYVRHFKKERECLHACTKYQTHLSGTLKELIFNKRNAI